MAHPVHDMTARERVEEIASILAEGILRLKCKNMRKSKRERAYSLDSIGNQSVHAPESKKKGKSAWETT
ncbi:MAG: hypothetical protein ACKVOE_02965 [Rickettsiales bacterium]